jgi:transcriptional regulator with XRE-family HTH domain
MHSLIPLRTKLGLSQLKMAQYLGIARSQLAMVEKGRRGLPTAAVLKLAKIELFVENTATRTKVTHPHEKQQQKTASQLLDKHLRELEYRQLKAARQLAQTEEQYNRYLLLLDLLEHLKADTNKVATDARHRNWLRLAEQHATAAINKHGLHIQAMQQIALHGLRRQQQTALDLKQQMAGK